MLSVVEKRSAVKFPEHLGERIYMLPVAGRLPQRFARWQDTVDQMLDGITPPSDVYLMVDQGVVQEGATLRRPGKHIDGNWLAAQNRHGGGGHVHTGRWDNPGNGWKHASAYAPEAIILATDVLGARAYAGQFETDIGPGGECVNVDIAKMQAVDLTPFHAWAGNVTMVHESLPSVHSAKRTVVRLNVPGWEPKH